MIKVATIEALVLITAEGRYLTQETTAVETEYMYDTTAKLHEATLYYNTAAAEFASKRATYRLRNSPVLTQVPIRITYELNKG